MGADEYSDGLFFMEFKDFIEYMTGYDISYYEDGYKHSSAKIKTDCEKPTLVEFTIRKPGTFYFSLHQVNIRAFKDSDSNFK
jgi:hypothetical protein